MPLYVSSFGRSPALAAIRKTRAVLNAKRDSVHVCSRMDLSSIHRGFVLSERPAFLRLRFTGVSRGHEGAGPRPKRFDATGQFGTPPGFGVNQKRPRHSCTTRELRQMVFMTIR